MNPKNKLAEMPTRPLLYTMAVPLMLSLLIQSLYNIVDRQLGCGKRNCHSGGTIPAHKKQDRPHHRPPDAHRSRCGSGGGAVGWHRGRAGQPGRAVRPEGTVCPHGGSAVGKPELDDLRMRAAFIWKKYCIRLKTVVYTLYETLL